MVHLACCTKEVTTIGKCKAFGESYLPATRSPWGHHIWSRSSFTGKFWKSLFDLLGTDLHFSTTFHLQTDDQFERMIHTMENFLRPYVKSHPKSWSQHLTLAEFTMNNVVNVAIGYIPFFLNSGDHPIISSILLHGKDTSSHVEVVQTMVDRMKAVLEEAQVNLSIAASWEKVYGNASRWAATFQVDDEVVLAMRHLCVDEHLPVRLRRRWIGPLSIAKEISPVDFRLDLPPT